MKYVELRERLHKVMSAPAEDKGMLVVTLSVVDYLELEKDIQKYADIGGAGPVNLFKINFWGEPVLIVRAEFKGVLHPGDITIGRLVGVTSLVAETTTKERVERTREEDEEMARQAYTGSSVMEMIQREVARKFAESFDRAILTECVRDLEGRLKSLDDRLTRLEEKYVPRY